MNFDTDIGLRKFTRLCDGNFLDRTVARYIFTRMMHLLKILWLVIFLTHGNLKVLAASVLDIELSDNAPSQCAGVSRGKHFVLGFIDNYDASALPSRRLFILVVAFSNQQTTVTISSRYETEGIPFQETFVIEAGGFMRTNVPVELVMENTERSNKVLEISASSDVSAYGLMYQLYTTDGFLGIPTNNLGMQYVVTTSRSSGTNFLSQFAVIGTEDSTLVQVTLRGAVAFEGISYNPGDVLRFNVSSSEAVQIQGQVLADLTGSIIQSDKPVAVFSGNECTNHAGSSCDTLTEQLIPVQSWGKNHIYTAARSDDDNIYRIVAYFSETNLTIPGFQNQSLKPGEFWEGRLAGSGLVTSSKPALMMQHLASINGIIVDPSFIQIPAVEHFGYVFGFTTPPLSGADSGGYFNFISIIVKNDSRETVYLNGAPINETIIVHESDVPNISYISLTVQVPKGEGVYYVQQTDPDSSPLSVIVYGYESSESYGYAAGLSLPGNEQTLRLSPYYLRELGGERLTMTVPCSYTFALNISKCKFSTGIRDVLVPCERTDAYTVVCITPTFYKNGLTSVFLSLDNGESYPYSGIVYVASEEDLPPLVQIQQMNSYADKIIDLTSDNPILLSWDPESLVEEVSHVNVMKQDTDYDSDGNPVLLDGVAVQTDVLNNGSLTIQPRALQSLGGDGLSLQAIYLTPSAERKRVIKITTSIVATVVGTCTVSRYQIRSTVPIGLPACPCNTAQANQDQNLEEANFANSFFHPGSENCFRSVNVLPNGAGQQCCYGADGNILVGPPGGGTADRYGPGGFSGTILHQWFDVLPWLCSCKLSNECNEYYKYRPSDDCSDYDPPRPAGGTGDPHLTNLDGYRFTFNGAGEFLMASSALHALTFQARMERYRNTNASVYTAFVLQTNDSSNIQVQMSSMNETLILVDGEALRLDSPIKVHHLRGVRISFNSDMSTIKIAFTAGIAVTVYVDTEMMSFIAQLDTKFKGQVRGLLGHLNDLQFPNGTTLEPGSSLKETHEYGLEWLVAQQDSIFTYISPYDYGTYYFPEFSPIFRVPDLNNVSQEVKDLCGNYIECDFDAVITGSLSFANETKEVMVKLYEAQKGLVKIVSCGYPGDVQNASVSGSVFIVNASVVISCDDGFTLNGSSRLTCLEDGHWSSDLPVCSSMMEDGGLTPGTIATVTMSPSTMAPDTMSPGTMSPGTMSHVTVTHGSTAPGTTAPATMAPDTMSPGTTSPSTMTPSTLTPGSMAPETTAPSTTSPGTMTPDTMSPGTTSPSTMAPGTMTPVTMAPSTISPGTMTPRTMAPDTISPGTMAPHTIAPGTMAFDTVSPGTMAPGTMTPSTMAPDTTAPSTIAPDTIAPGTMAPDTMAPDTMSPSTMAPDTISPGTMAPGTMTPDTMSPGTMAPDTISPGTIAPGTMAPGTMSPGTMSPDTMAPGTMVTDTMSPGTMAPDTTAPIFIASGIKAPGVIASIVVGAVIFLLVISGLIYIVKIKIKANNTIACI